MKDFGSRKFLLAVFAQLVGTIGLFVDKLGGGEYVALTTVVLGLYGAANVAAVKVGK